MLTHLCHNVCLSEQVLPNVLAWRELTANNLNRATPLQNLSSQIAAQNITDRRKSFLDLSVPPSLVHKSHTSASLVSCWTMGLLPPYCGMCV